jgi:dienelactone hydrolase
VTSDRRHVGIAAGLLIGTALLLALTQPLRYAGPPLDAVLLPVAGLLVVLALAGVAAVLAVLAVLFRRIPLLVRAVGTGAFLVVLATVAYVVGFGLAGATGSMSGAIVVTILVTVALVALMAVVGASIATLLDGIAPPRRRRRAVAALLASAAVVLVAVLVLRAPGDDAFVAAPLRAPPPPRLELADPSAPGPYEVATLTYGSGLDRRREAFGPAGVTIATASVDASALWGAWPRARSAYWGFDTTALPRNARVWYPVGDGPFPLVLAVHGNHPLSMWRPADEGYAYLAAALASRGFIVASIDQNFLNDAPRRYAAPGGETLVRAWLLLEHLRQWRAWQAVGTTPLGTSIDTSRIALVGHSRGGEAALLAVGLNALERLPDDGRVRLGHGFDIGAVVAIAPTDMFYEASGRRLPVEGVSYLALHGSNDNDVQGFQGSRAYGRVDVGGDGDDAPFKAAVYVDRANHGQFNTLWGDTDRSGAAGWFLNRAPLMSAEEQQQVATVLVTSFLEATLGGDDAYREVLRDPRHAWPWLPEVAVHAQYLDATFVPVATFDDGVDPGRTSAPGGRIDGDGLAIWVEEDVDLRSPAFFGTRESRAVRLAWTEPGAHYTVVLPDGLTLPERAAWTFAFAEPTEGAPARERADDEPIDFTLELVWDDGSSATLALSDVHAAQPPIRTRLTRIPFVDRPTAPTTFQTVTVPLARFAAAAGDRAPTTLAALRFRFDRQASGAVLLDDIGFVALPATAPGP